MLPIKLACVMSAFLFLSFAACSKENKSSAPGTDKPPADFNLVFGEGGGFTGLWQGFAIHADGTVTSWQGKAPGENAKPSGKLSGKQMKALWQEIHKSSFFSQEMNERGNMTAIMRVTANGATKELAWIPQFDAAAAAKTAPQQLQQNCRQLVEKVAKK